MTFSRLQRRLRLRRVLRGVGLTLGLTVVVAIAMVGAVIGLVVLAIGAVVLSVARGLRRIDGAASPRPQSTVVEGEYRVVQPGAPRGVARLTAPATNG